MQNVKTIAVIGAADKRNLTVLKELSDRYQMLLFDKNSKALSDICDSLLTNNRNVNIEKMSCATDASWEADIIILSGFCINDAEIVRKVQKVATAKIIIIMENDDEFTKSINSQVNFDLVFPHSKIVEIINLNTDEKADKEFLLEGHDSSALDSVSNIFERMGFNTFVSQLN
ncbi:MAG: ribosomal protein L18E [Flavobacterium sp.]|jgi:ribosomal protein L18E